MIEGVSASGTIGVAAVTAMRYARMDGQALIMPVRPAQMITASFKHIQMRPDSRLENGIPLYKLRILDRLIDQLSPSQAGNTIAPGTPSEASIGSIDDLIATMSETLRGSASSYRDGFLPEPGAFVDLLA